MSLIASLGKVAVSAVAVRAVSAVGTLLVLRYLAPDQYASFVLLFAIGSIAYSIVGPALNRIFVVEARRLSLSASSDFFALQMVGLFALTIALAPVVYIHPPLFIAVVFAAARLVGDFPRNSHIRDQRFGSLALQDFVRNALAAAAVAGVIFAPELRTAGWTLAAYIAADSAAFLFFVLMSRMKVTLTLQHWRVLLKAVSPPLSYIFFYTAGLAIYTQIEVFVLERWALPQDVATFGAAMRYYGLLVGVLTSMNSVYLPKFAALTHAAEIDKLLSQHYRIVWGGAVVLVLVAITASWWIPLVDGGKYPESIAAFRILCLSAFLSFVFNPHVNILMRFSDYRYIFLILLCSAVLLAAPRLWLMASYGSIGAAWSVLLAFLFLNGGFYLRARTLRRRWTAREISPSVVVGQDETAP